MELSLFLAKVFGLYLIFVIPAVLLKQRELKVLVDESFNNRVFLFFSGAIILILGLLVVLNHNIWEASWRGVITLIGWITLFKGIMRIYAPEKAKNIAKSVVQGTWYTVILIAFLLVGVWLSYIGFTY